MIIGSHALKHWGVNIREPRDMDVISPEWIEGKDCIVFPQDLIDKIPQQDGYITLDGLYTLKCSHLGWDIKWQKHKNDALYLKALGCNLIEDLYEDLVAFWKEENGNKDFLSLYKKKDDFFNDYVPYVYDHDYLHELVVWPTKPIYTYCLKDGEDVAIDKEKFDCMSLDMQLRMFKEEISVIAAERWLIPPKICGKYSWHKAYSLSVHKTVTAFTKNWATDFMIRHLDFFVKPDYTYFKHMFDTLKEGEIIMGKQVENWREIVEEIFEAYNEKDPSYPLEYAEELEEINDLEGFEFIEQEGGGEGGAEDCHMVFKWKEKFYRLEYSYYSYHGTDFDGAIMYEVTPTQKMVTVYE